MKIFSFIPILTPGAILSVLFLGPGFNQAAAFQSGPDTTASIDRPALAFEVFYFAVVKTSAGSAGQIVRKHYTLNGPVDGGTLFPAVASRNQAMRLVSDPGQTVYFGTLFQEVYKVDPLTGAATLLSPESSFTDFSWPMGITFDTKRSRAVLVTLGGEGFLYAYSPNQNRWSLIRSMDNLDLDSIEYHAADDSLYGLGVYHPGGRPTLYKFNAAGLPQSQVELPVFPFSVAPGGYRSELLSVGEYLVLLVEPENPSPQADTAAESRIYLIDPRSGQAELTYARPFPPVNPLPTEIIEAQRELPELYMPGAAFTVRITVNPGPAVSAFALEDQPPLGWAVTAISSEGVFDASTRKIKFGPFFDNTRRIVSYSVAPPAGTSGAQRFNGRVSANGQNRPIAGDESVEMGSSRHPADNAPADNAISLTELTRYAGSWKNGVAWPVGPNPIPLSYVTRAGLLWKQGESYAFDPRAGSAPLWWVSRAGGHGLASFDGSSEPVSGEARIGGQHPLHPRVLGIAQAPDHRLMIRFEAPVHSHITIEYAHALSSGSWRPLISLTVGEATTEVALPAPDGNSRQVFYRLRGVP